MKVVRCIRRYTESAEIEADILRAVNRRSRKNAATRTARGRGQHNIVRFFGDFMFRGRGTMYLLLTNWMVCAYVNANCVHSNSTERSRIIIYRFC